MSYVICPTQTQNTLTCDIVSLISGVAENFERRGGIISTFFPAYFFFSRTHLKLIDKQRKALGESGGMLPGKNFEN